jgi:hypothetical protein
VSHFIISAKNQFHPEIYIPNFWKDLLFFMAELVSANADSTAAKFYSA